MRTVSLTLDYLPIEKLIDLIDEPNRSICHAILTDNRSLFEQARGSTHNHQTWDGGYIDTLPVDEANTALADLELWEPALYSEVKALFDTAYPNGRPGTAEFEAYRHAEVERIVSSIPEPEPAAEPVYTPPAPIVVPEIAAAPVVVPVVAESEIIPSENPVEVQVETNETATTTSSVPEGTPVTEEEAESEQPEKETTEPKQPGIPTRVLHFSKS